MGKISIRIVLFTLTIFLILLLSIKFNDNQKVTAKMSGIVNKSQALKTAQVKITSGKSEIKKPLDNIIVGIDPGHQQKGDKELESIAPGSDIKKAKVTYGTQGRFTKVKEYELNLDVGLLLKSELEKLGASIIMTRERNDVNLSNSQRAEITNKSKCDVVVRLHANGSDDPKANGYSILVPGKKYTEKIVDKSMKFAQILDGVLKQEVAIRSEGIVIRDDLTGFNWSKTPVILLEMGYMTNQSDDRTMQTREFKMAVVKSIASAVEAYVKENQTE